MLFRTLITFYFIPLLMMTNTSCAQGTESIPRVGPAKGSLLIVGGGRLSETIFQRFIDLAGGLDAAIVVVPTALGGDDHPNSRGDFLRNMGATNITVLHTNDPKVANSKAFLAPLQKANGVWFTGGRQWRLVDAYKNTKAEKLFWEVLNRGGVIGGSSAGATIQGSFLARGDTKHNQIMMGDHEEGFGFLKNTAIDQHVLARNRQFDLLEILNKRPELLGIGLDENTAIVVQGDVFEVIGASYVLMYDTNFWSVEGFASKKLPPKESLFYFLKSGDRYDLNARKVLR